MVRSDERHAGEDERDAGQDRYRHQDQSCDDQHDAAGFSDQVTHAA